MTEPINIDFGRESKYPWTVWLDKEPHIITMGEDFHVALHKMQTQLHTRASKEGMKVRTKTLDAKRLAFQYFDLPVETTD